MFSLYAMIGRSKEFWKGRQRGLDIQDPQSTNHPSFTTTNEAYAHEMYLDVYQDQAVYDFLQTVPCYDTTQQRWRIPDTSAPTEVLLSSIYAILGSIVEQFSQTKDLGIEREVICTHRMPGCEGKDAQGYRACPLLVVRAAGPSFELPIPLDPQNPTRQVIGFSNMAAYFSARNNSVPGCEKEDVEEMASYARQIFRAQPNRIFVRSLLFSGDRVRLFHFDRAGSQITPLIDIHKNPATLVRLVAGLSSTKEGVLGLDSSVQWTIVNGRKESGTLTTTGPRGDPRTYPILGQIPTARDSIRGRGTTCWRVRDPETGEEYVVKDSWRPDDRPAEHELLELVKGLPGLAQLASYEEGRGETKYLRCQTTDGQYHNRIATRVMMDSYGKPIYCFQSVLQLLCAIRDAINGHRFLVGDRIRILHRDISHNNILLGTDKALDGFRGVLIDLDMAFRGTDANPKATAKESIGTRMFQSLSVLESAYHKARAPAHDHLDELESFFYLLTYILLAYRPDGTQLRSEDEGPSLVSGWADDDTETAHANKRVLFGAGPTAERSLRLVEEGWGAVCGTLFEELRWWVYEKSCEKTELLGGRAAARVAEPLKSLLTRREEHYTEVLKIFDEAIEALQISDTSPAPSSTIGIQSAISCQSVKVTLETTEISSPSSKPQPPIQLRRSARIRDLRVGASKAPPPSLKACQPSKRRPPPPLRLDAEPRRSARLQKRRLEEDKLDLPPPKSRRTTRIWSHTARPC